MLPRPSVNYIPTLSRQHIDRGWIALTNFLDKFMLEVELETIGLEYLADVERCPSFLLESLGNKFNAGLNPEDGDRLKRQKIYYAIENHKKGGLWFDSVKGIIDNLTGLDAVFFTGNETDEYIWKGDAGDEISPPTFAVWGGNVAGDGGQPWQGGVSSGPGFLRIDLGGTAGNPVQSVIDKVRFEMEKVAPAYYAIYLGYVMAGNFIVYPNGAII